MSKSLLFILFAFLCNNSLAQTIPALIDYDISSIGQGESSPGSGDGWPDVSSSTGDVQIKSGIGGNTTVTFDNMNNRGGHNNDMDYYSIIEGNLILDADQTIIIEDESYLVINGDLILNGTLQYNNTNGASKSVYLIVLGSITGSGTITGGDGAHDEPPYASGEITVGGQHNGGSGENINSLPSGITTILEGAGYDLPVELISFTANKEDKNILLKWSTATEVNASHFDIYSSYDKKAWNLVGTADASGNTNTKVNYTFTDNNEYSGTIYYKLVQYDFDGQNETFGPIKLVIDGDSEEISMEIFPNPSSEAVNIQIAGIKSDNVSIQVISKEGRVVYSETLDTNNVQSYLYRIDDSLQPGLYFIKTKSGLEESFGKVLIK